VSVQKGNAYVKDIQIKATGIWKAHQETLVYVIKTVDVPFAKEVYGISQTSLEQLSNHFSHRFDSQPIRILNIESLNARSLNVRGENGLETHYTR